MLGEDISTAQALLGSRYKYTLSDTAEITDDLAFTFSLSDGDDWRTSNAAALTVKIAAVFSLKVSNIVRYVNAPRSWVRDDRHPDQCGPRRQVLSWTDTPLCPCVQVGAAKLTHGLTKRCGIPKICHSIRQNCRSGLIFWR